eukprot:PhM_4_TR2098/c2_g3_i2/m.36890
MLCAVPSVACRRRGCGAFVKAGSARGQQSTGKSENNEKNVRVMIFFIKPTSAHTETRIIFNSDNTRDNKWNFESAKVNKKQAKYFEHNKNYSNMSNSFTLLSFVVVVITLIISAAPQAATAQAWNASALSCRVYVNYFPTLSADAPIPIVIRCRFALNFPELPSHNTNSSGNYTYAPSVRGYPDLPEYAGDKFEVVSDGCTHYSDLSCPSKVVSPKWSCTNTRCFLDFDWRSPPASAGTYFTLFVLWKEVRNFVVVMDTVRFNWAAAVASPAMALMMFMMFVQAMLW